jgi:hypothetical protein
MICGTRAKGLALLLIVIAAMRIAPTYTSCRGSRLRVGKSIRLYNITGAPR